MDDGRPLRTAPRRRDLSGLSLAELMVAGNELRRRSKRVFEDMAALEVQLQKYLSHDPGACAKRLN